MLEDYSLLHGRRVSLFAEFDRPRRRTYPDSVSARVRKTLQLDPEVVEAARQRGVALGDYIYSLHQNQRSVRVAFVASIFRGFALLELARVPVDPAYYDLVTGVLGGETGHEFRTLAGSGIAHALPTASAKLLGADTRAPAIEALLLSAQRAKVLHEGFMEGARLLEATYYR